MPGEIPTPAYDKEVRRLVAYYKRAFRDLANELKGAAGGIEQAQAVSLLQQIELILRELDGNVLDWCQEVITQAFKDGQAETLVSLGVSRTLSEAAAASPFSLLARSTVEALVNDTYQDLLLATQNTERKVKAIVRNVTAKTMRLNALQQNGRVTTTKKLFEDLSAKGLSKSLESEGWVGVVDRAGRRWSLSTYSDMVVRTKLNQAWVEGVRVETAERGVDLATISRHGAEDSCGQFEGMVISLHGLTPGYLTYDELRRSQLIFHPNCQHKARPLRELDLLNERQKVEHELAMKRAKKALGQ